MSFLERLLYLLGQEQIEKLRNATVAVIGLGGVGGVAAITLARSGVGSLLIQDYDIVQESNINRQIIANYQTLGRKKTDVCEEEILKINPNCKVIKLDEKFNQESELFSNKFDYLIDAIDSVPDKKMLIEKSLENKICFISSMGAAKKTEPTKLSIMDLRKTSYDPLAKILRSHFRDYKEPIMVVSSTEEVKPIPNLGSYMPVTATAGLLLADYIIKKIIGG
jgi:tRNA A37 threonylcarbamoyladenosine dehydratase